MDGKSTQPVAMHKIGAPNPTGINTNGSRTAPCGARVNYLESRDSSCRNKASTVPLFYCAVCNAGDGHVAVISAIQSRTVCPAFCNAALGLAMFNVVDGTLLLRCFEYD